MDKNKLNKIRILLNISIRLVSLPAIIETYLITSNLPATLLLIMIVYEASRRRGRDAM
jgi:hypothetical protein